MLSGCRWIVVAACLLLVVGALGCEPPAISVETSERSATRAVHASAGYSGWTFLIDDQRDLYTDRSHWGRVSLANDLYYQPFPPLAQVDAAMDMCGLTLERDLICDASWPSENGHEEVESEGVALVGVTSFSVGLFHICAVTQEAELWCWGYNLDGALLTEERLVTEPRRIPLDDVRSVSAGMPTCAVTGAGALFCWGYQTEPHGEIVAPIAVEGIPEVASVSTSKFAGRLCVVTWERRVYCWAINSDEGPVEVGLSHVAAVSVSDEVACALTSDGELFCWGSNGYGQLGQGDTEDRSEPTRVDLPEVVEVDVGFQHTVAITDSGELYGWGALTPPFSGSEMILTPTRYLW